MEKREIRSSVWNLLPKYAAGSEYHPEVVDRAIEKAINQLYTETFLRSPLSIQRYVKRFGGTTGIPVIHDAISGLYYSNYPTGYSIVPLPDKASGVRRITTVTQAGVQFFPMDQRELELVASGSYFAYTSDKIGYVVTQDRIEYYGLRIMTIALTGLGLRMDLLIPFSDYADTDNILIPEMPNAGGETFVDMVLKILGVIRPQETIDDNLTAIPTNTK